MARQLLLLQGNRRKSCNETDGLSNEQTVGSHFIGMFLIGVGMIGLGLMCRRKP